MRDVVYLILDCNILLHFQPPDQIDWPALCGSKEVRIVLYPKLLTEVSNNKDMNPRKHLRDRAASRERWLRDHRHREPPIRQSVFLVSQPDEHRELTAELGLDRTVADDAIVAQAVAHQRLGRDVCVATADFGLEMKLEHRSIRVIVPDDRFKLAPEPDPERVRADKAERRLRDLEERLPRFEASIQGEAQVSLLQLGITKQAFVAKVLADLQEQFKEEQMHQAKRLGYIMPHVTMDNTAIEDRLGLEQFLTSFFAWQERIVGSVPISIRLSNTGGCVATNVRVAVRSAGGLRLYHMRDLVVSPQRPMHIYTARMLKLEGSYHFPVDVAGYQLTSARLSPDQTFHWTEERLAHLDFVTLTDMGIQGQPDATSCETSLTLTVICDQLSAPQSILMPVSIVSPG